MGLVPSNTGFILSSKHPVLPHTVLHLRRYLQRLGDAMIVLCPRRGFEPDQTLNATGVIHNTSSLARMVDLMN